MTVTREDLDAGQTDLAEVIDASTRRAPPVHPGRILLTEWLEPLGMSAYRLAKDINVPASRVSEILNGNRAISAETALRLARLFGTDAQSWLNLQSAYELAKASAEHGARIAEEVRTRAA